MKTVMREKQWAEKYPDLGTEPVPTEPYVSDEHYELERERIFRRCWINVGRVDEIPNPGDYFVRDIAICKTSVLIIRGSDGVVRGFFNVCSHRGNTLVLDERGTCPGSVYCHFHNWVYSDTGELIRVPDEENFFDFDKRDHGLTPVNTDFWEGFVFVHLGPEPAETLREYLGGVADQLDGCPFHEMPLMQTYLVDERANWKVGSTRRTSSITCPSSTAASGRRLPDERQGALPLPGRQSLQLSLRLVLRVRPDPQACRRWRASSSPPRMAPPSPASRR